MNTEIELKYLVVNDNLVEKVSRYLTTKQYAYVTEEKTLANCYFDTGSLAFRQHDFGLRVRSQNGLREQTIKTAGQTIGGLHKRPEYNVDIDNNLPDLTLFPETIWPESVNVLNWQKELVVLFSTDFVRVTWEITYQQSVIEMAFDQGTVSASGRELPICEIELELVTGLEQDILDLAKELSSVLLMRPGNKSKAARGYQLFHDQPDNLSVIEFPLVPIEVSYSGSEAFIKGTTFCLSHLQKIIDIYFVDPSLNRLSQLNHALLLCRHAFWMFDDFLTDNEILVRKEISHFLTLFAWENNAKNLHEIITKSGIYRKKIEYNQALVKNLKLEERRFPSTAQVQELLLSSRFNQMQLALLSLILKGEASLKKREVNSESILSFTANALDKSLNELVGDISTERKMSAEQYLSHKRILNRSLLTGSWCGQLFNKQARSDYRAPWLDLMQGLTELETLSMLKLQLQQQHTREENSEKLVKWLDSKIDNLLDALDSSRQIALAVAPYWRV